MGNEAITVSEFNALINQTMSFAYPEVVVEGEVSSYKVSQDKWVFFDLKDKDSVVGCFMTIYNLKSEIQDGMLIRVKAVPQLTKWGKFSLTVREIELAGEGSVKRSFEILKAKLAKEGLFASSRKRLLPEFPANVLLITSKQAAAYNDFLSIINDRWSGLTIDHIQVQVQGSVALPQIADAIAYANNLESSYDAVVLIRGGGSAEDLQVFNTEEVVRAVYSSVVPILVAIGHEDDVCLAELAADLRAATPSDAARRLVPDRLDILNQVAMLRAGITSAVESEVISSRASVEKFYHSIEARISNLRYELGLRVAQSSSAVEQLLKTSNYQLDSYRKLLGSLDPRAILARGYSIARVNGRVIRSARDYKMGDNIVLQLHQGQIIMSGNKIGNNNDQK